MGCKTTHDNTEAASDSDVVLVSVKPNVVPRVLEDICKSVTSKRPLVASIALGVTVKEIESYLPLDSRVMRLMPNTPALINMGASVFSRGTHATQEDAILTSRFVLPTARPYLDGR